MVRKIKSSAVNFDILGNLLILLSVLVLFFTVGPVAKEEAVYKTREVLNIKPDLTPPNTDFSIVIPKIAAVAPIVDGVDPYNSASYLSALRRGVAHANGTAYPGESGNTYLFAHSTDSFYNVGRYNAVFYLIGKLEKGDSVEVYFKGKKIKYEVFDKKVVEAGAVQYLKKTSKEKILTLQTCYPPGTTLKRLIVLAKEVE